MPKIYGGLKHASGCRDLSAVAKLQAYVQRLAETEEVLIGRNVCSLGQFGCSGVRLFALRRATNNSRGVVLLRNTGQLRAALGHAETGTTVHMQFGGGFERLVESSLGSTRVYMSQCAKVRSSRASRHLASVTQPTLHSFHTSQNRPPEQS